MRINELGNKISDWEVKLKQQQQLYESVRSDRNLYSKNLIEAQDEIAEMKRKLKIMNHQIEQLKEDITAKVSAFSCKLNLGAVRHGGKSASPAAAAIHIASPCPS